MEQFLLFLFCLLSIIVVSIIDLDPRVRYQSISWLISFVGGRGTNKTRLNSSGKSFRKVWRRRGEVRVGRGKSFARYHGCYSGNHGGEGGQRGRGKYDKSFPSLSAAGIEASIASNNQLMAIAIVTLLIGTVPNNTFFGQENHFHLSWPEQQSHNVITAPVTIILLSLSLYLYLATFFFTFTSF